MTECKHEPWKPESIKIPPWSLMTWTSDDGKEVIDVYLCKKCDAVYWVKTV